MRPATEADRAAGRRLDLALDRRRIELRLTWGQFCKQVGITRAGLGGIRRGERRPMALTCAWIEEALMWAPGTVDAILNGGEPSVPKPVTLDERRGSPTTAYDDPDERYIWELDELSGDFRREIISQLRRARIRRAKFGGVE